jgi:alpha-D-xyloside xylohydrolase
VRAGSILPLASAALSTATARWDALEIRVFDGADGYLTLYEDDGTSYDYEHGAHSRIDFSWNERERTLSISAPRGRFPGMLARRMFTVTTPGGPSARVEYDGTPVTVALVP